MDRKKKITRQQYLEALELIDMYHRQSSNINERDSGKTRISDWINSLNEAPSARLHNALVSFEYFEDVNKPAFLKCRNVGTKAWEEFCSLANIKP